MRKMNQTELRDKSKQIWRSWLCGYSFPNASMIAKLVVRLAKKEKARRDGLEKKTTPLNTNRRRRRRK